MLCSLEQQCGATVLVGKLCHQSLSFSGFMALSRLPGKQCWTSDLQVEALERGPLNRIAGRGSNIVIALQRLQLDTDYFWTTHCWILHFRLVVQCPMADEHRYILSIISLHMTRIEKDFPVDCRLDSWRYCLSSLLAKILKVWCWHDQSNQSYSRYNVIWSHFICGQWPWAFLDGTSNVNLWQHPRGLNFWALPVDFAET